MIKAPQPSDPVLSQVLEFEWVAFKENHCRALATLRRTDLELQFHGCTVEPQDAEGILIEWFRRTIL
jgi:hypothetical protein